MSNLSAKLASAFIVTAATGLGLAVSGLPDQFAKAADGCRKEAGDGTPQGKHWYYRLEHGTGRQCWYLRGEDEKSASADAPSPVPAAKPAPRKQDVATTRSIADAHAELSPRTRVAEDAPPALATSPVAASPAAAPADNAAAATALASRWPQTASAAPAYPAAAANAAPEATLMVADAEPDANTDASAQPAVAPPPPVAAPVERQTGSIQKLFLVAFGALALAGLTGSAVYRLGRRRTRNDWLRERSNWQSEANPRNPPWIEREEWVEPEEAEWVEPASAGPNMALADLDETHGVETLGVETHGIETHGVVPESDFAQASDFAQVMPETEDSEDGVEKIEEFLARLTAKLHQELEGTRDERNAHAAS